MLVPVLLSVYTELLGRVNQWVTVLQSELKGWLVKKLAVLVQWHSCIMYLLLILI